FNAIEHALEPPANEPPAAPPPDFFILEDKPAPTPAGLSPASMLDFGIPEPEREPEPESAPKLEPARAEKPAPFAWKVAAEAEPQVRAAPAAATDLKAISASTPAAEPAPHPIQAASAGYEPAGYDPTTSAPAET